MKRVKDKYLVVGADFAGFPLKEVVVEHLTKKGWKILDLGVSLNIIKKSGSWFSYNETKLAQGRDAAKQVIADNPELAEELEGLILEALKNK